MGAAVAMNSEMKNVIQIWDSLGRVVPFSVRRWCWSEHSEFVVRRVVVKKFPYGDVYGDYCHDGHVSNRNRNQRLANSGCYQWMLVLAPSLERKVVAPSCEAKENEGVCPVCGERMQDMGKYIGSNPKILALIASGDDFALDPSDFVASDWVVGGHRGGCSKKK